MAYVIIPDASLAVDKYLVSPTLFALRDNPVSSLLGEPGAQRVLGQAIARPNNGLPVLTVSASLSQSTFYAAINTTGNFTTSSTTPVLCYSRQMVCYTGSCRMTASHMSSGGGAASTIYFTKNGTTVYSASTTSTSLVARSFDVTFTANDTLAFYHDIQVGSWVSTIDLLNITADDAYVPQYPLIPASQV